MTRLLISDIVITDRARAAGDIASLAASINELGLLQPIVVNPRNELVFGLRRLTACKELGHTHIGAIVNDNAADALSALRAELAENVERTAFTPSEAASLRERIRGLLRPIRTERRRDAIDESRDEAGRFGARRADDETPPAIETPRVVDVPLSAAQVDAQIEAATGISASTLKRVSRISSFVESADPVVAEAAADAIARIDAGAPVKPLLDKIVETATAAAVTRYPVLAGVADPLHVQRLATHLDGIAASSDGEALNAELRVLELQVGSPEDAASRKARERVFELNTMLAAAAAQWAGIDGKGLLTQVGGSLDETTRRTWEQIATDLKNLSDDIVSAITDQAE